MDCERPVVFACGGAQLVGIVSVPQSPLPRGVIVVVGGPQYRVGSHRQFTLLCRTLSRHSIPTLRFDYRGMGDSEGDPRTFDDIQDDIAAAVAAFFAQVPGLREVVVWGLCDAASAALFYAHKDSRVSGLVLLNPWLRTVEGEAKTYLRHYYGRRIFETAFWGRLFRGEVELKSSLVSLAGMLRRAAGSGEGVVGASSGAIATGSPVSELTLPARMEEGLRRFKGKVLLILSGKDLVAREFCDVTGQSSSWRDLLSDPRVHRCALSEATHTFSSREWRDQVAEWTAAWVLEKQVAAETSHV